MIEALEQDQKIMTVRFSVSLFGNIFINCNFQYTNTESTGNKANVGNVEEDFSIKDGLGVMYRKDAH